MPLLLIGIFPPAYEHHKFFSFSFFYIYWQVTQSVLSTHITLHLALIRRGGSILAKAH